MEKEKNQKWGVGKTIGLIVIAILFALIAITAIIAFAFPQVIESLTNLIPSLPSISIPSISTPEAKKQAINVINQLGLYLLQLF